MDSDMGSLVYFVPIILGIVGLGVWVIIDTYRD